MLYVMPQVSHTEKMHTDKRKNCVLGGEMKLVRKSISGIVIVFSFIFILASNPAHADWGAVGFGPGGAWGYSAGQYSQRQAWRKVNRSCRGNCTVIKTFQNLCGAIAAGPDNGWGWTSSRSMRGAKRGAMRQCRRNSYDCSLRAWACAR